jgi:hypothetical protein
LITTYAINTGDQAHVSLVVKAIQDTVANPLAMRALGFCLSVAHADSWRGSCHGAVSARSR